MRRNKVLTTLAAVSMSAMMAVSAAPAVTVMAANETAEEATNTGATEQYRVDAYYKELPILFVANTQTAYGHIQGVVDGKTLKDDELKTVAVGTKVTNVKITNEAGDDLLQGGEYEYTVKKATPTIAVDKNGNVTASAEEVKNATVVPFRSGMAMSGSGSTMTRPLSVQTADTVIRLSSPEMPATTLQLPHTQMISQSVRSTRTILK